MKNIFKQLLSVAMVLALIVSMVPVSAMAEDTVTHQHSYTSAVTREATCAVAGVTTFTCAVEGCDRPTYTESIAATGSHTYENGVCAVCGGAETAAHQHNYTSAVTQEATCAVAGVTTFTCAVEGCDRPTYTEPIAATGEHSYKDGACEVCGGAEPACEHHYVDGKCESCQKDVPVCVCSEACVDTVNTECEACTENQLFCNPVAVVEENPVCTCVALCTETGSCDLCSVSITNCVPSAEVKLPNAEVIKLGKKTVAVESYYIYDLIGGGGLSNGTEPFNLQIAMEFLAKDTLEQAQANYYANYTTDFFIKMTGMENSSFVGKGCYLAGYYPSFGAWVKIPMDGFEVQNGVTYPVITGAGFDFKYTDICSGVQDFICGIYLSDEVLEANPNLKVTLDLGLSKTLDEALDARYVKVGGYEYSVMDMIDVVAKIGETAYTSLEAAVAAAQSGETIKLQDDITLTDGITVAADKNIKLDLNGKTITGSPAEAKAYAVITNIGSLAIIGNGSVVCDHKLAGSTSYAVNTIVNSGTLTINGPTIQNKSTASNQIGYAIDNNSTSYDAVLNIQSGKIIVSGSYYYDGIRQFCNNQDKENSVTVAGGEVGSIWLQNPSDGSGSQNNKDVKGSVTISGGTVNALYLEPSSAFEASISGGNVGSVSYFQTASGRDLTGFITGGTFSSNVSKFCAEGYEVVYQNSKYAVTKKAELTADTKAPEITVSNNVTVSATVNTGTADTAKGEITENDAAKKTSGLDSESNETAISQATAEAMKSLSASEAASATTEAVVAITLTAMDGDNAVIDKLTFDVTPLVVVKVGNEVKGTEKIEDLQTAITFRLPLPSSFVADFVNVYHEGVRMNTIPLAVMGSAPNRYVEVASADFSEFAVETADLTDTPKVAAIGTVGYETLEAAIKAAKTNETVMVLADTISESISVKLDQSITINGNGATMTGELWLGNDSYSYGDGTKADISVKVTGFNFETRGLAVAQIKTVEITGNTFKNISATSSTADSNRAAIKVWYADNATISGNTIDTTGEAGIRCNYISGTATITNNTVKNTAHNAILVSTGNKAVVTGNILQNWGTSGEGRALRSDVSELTFNDNAMRHTNAPEEYVKVTGFTDTSKINLENNDWNGREPTAAMVAAAGVTISEYVGKPVVAKIGNTPYTTMAAAIANVADGQTITLQQDITLTEAINATKDITIDANGHSIKGNNITLQAAAGKKLILEGLGLNGKLGVALSAGDTATVDADGVITVNTTQDTDSNYGTLTLCTEDSQGVKSDRLVFVVPTAKLVIKSTTSGFDENAFNGEYMLDMKNADGVYSRTLNEDDVYTWFRDHENVYVRGTNNTLTIVSSGFYDTCKRINVDDSTVYLKENNYTEQNVVVLRGCTELEMKSAFLTKLTAGIHTVKFLHEIDGKEYTVTDYFWVKASGSVPDHTCPKTGDYIMTAVAVMGISVAALAVLLIIRKKKS